MNAPEHRSFAFGRFHLDPLRGRLSGGGTVIELRPKSLAVLHYLVSHPQRLISKDELLAAVWDKVIVTEDSLVQCVCEIRQALADAEQRFVRTIPRGGYMFVAEVEEDGPASLDAPLPALALPPPSSQAPTRVGWRALTAWIRGRRWAVGAIAGSVLAMVIVAAMILLRFGGLSEIGASVVAPPLSIVVLPLANIGGEPEYEYFAHGLTSDLTTDLGRIPSGLVISHNSVRAYRSRQVDSREVGRELGVRYALEGSVQRIGDAVQVNLRLIETASGVQRWAERFESPRAELPQLQADIVRRIAQTLQLRLLEAEAERSVRERTRDANAQDLMMRGWSLWERRRPADNAQARDLFTQALLADSKYSLAWVGLANTHISDLHAGWAENRQASLEQAGQAMSRAYEVGPRHREVNAGRGYVLFFQGDIEAALAAFDQEIETNAGNALAHVWRALMLISLGRPAQALPAVERAIVMSPRDVDLNVFYRSMAHAHFSLGRFDEAVAWSRKAVGHTPAYAKGHSFLAASAALAGDGPAAASAIETFRRLQPKWGSVATFKEGMMPGETRMFDATPRFWHGLEQAGLPAD